MEPSARIDSTGAPLVAESAVLAALASFVPAQLLRQIARDARAPQAARAETLHGAALFADIRGFTALAEKLAARGAEGAEALSELLNASFGRLLQVVGSHGGEVLRFPGDAAIALWPADDAAGVADAAQRAAACGLDLQSGFAEGATPGGLRLRVGIASGEMRALTIGGVQDRWEWLVTGEPIEAAGRAQALAPIGRVALDATARAALGARARCGALAGPAPPAPQAFLLEAVDVIAAAGSARAIPLPATAELMHPFVSRGARALVAAGQLDWLAELRRVSVLFASLPRSAADDVATLQRAFAGMQESIYHFGGSINQCLADDKGFVVVAGWGLPSATYENSAQRALEAAMAVHAAAAAQGLGLAVGVSTGLAFCGLRGGAQRREYSMIGDIVNLAARLMQAAGDGVLCDDATRRAAPRIDCESRPPLALKGRELPVAVHRPLGSAAAAARGAAERPGLIGRRAERDRLAVRLRDLVEGRRGGLLLVEGEAGLGKSRLLEELLDLAAAHPVRTLLGKADAIEHATPYHAWRVVVEALLGFAQDAPMQERRQRVAAAFSGRPALAAQAPLLDAILHLGLPLDPALERYSGLARAEAVRELVSTLLAAAAGAQPVLLVIEDAHWLDGASWSLVYAAALLELPLLLVLSTRPLEPPVPAQAEAVLAMPSLERLGMQPLAAEDVSQLIHACLGASRVPGEVGELVFQRAEGNPFFSQELAFALRDAGVLELAGGEARLVGGREALSRLDLPDNVQGVVSSRIDRVPPPEALALKVGSVIGRQFAELWLAAVLPVRADAAVLQQQLGHLVTLDLLLALAQAENYAFKHAITQSVAYGLLSYALRRELHQRLAAWIEREQAANLPPYYATLAHHWTQAENKPKAIEYLDRAGVQSLRAGAHREAAAFFTRALALADAPASAGERLQQARWRRQLADAQWGLGDLAAAVEQSRLTLDTLGRPAPRHSAGWAALLARESLRALLRRRGSPASAADRPAMAEAALALQRISERHWYAQDVLPLVAASLAAVNLSDRAGDQAPVARTYGMIGVVLGFVGLHGLAEQYFHRALEHAARTNDLAGLVFAQYAYGSYLCGQARWADLRRASDEGLAGARALGDPQELEVALTVSGHLAFYTGDYPASLAAFEQVRRSALNRSAQHAAWGHYAQGRALVYQGNFDAAITHLEGARELLRPLSDDMSNIICNGLLALARLRRGELDRAAASADATMKLMLANQPNVFAYVEPYAAVLEVRLAQLSRDRNSSGARRQAAAAAAQLRRLAFFFPLARARQAALSGLHAQVRGRDAKALACFQRALSHADERQLPWDRAHACYRLSRCTALAADARRSFAGEARSAFARLGAEAHLDSLDRAPA